MKDGEQIWQQSIIKSSEKWMMSDLFKSIRNFYKQIRRGCLHETKITRIKYILRM